MNKNLLVTKRSGKQEAIDLDKIHRIIALVAEGLDNTVISQASLPSRNFIRFCIRFSAALLISETIIERRQKLVFVHIFILEKLCVKRPNNKSPPNIINTSTNSF